MHHSQQFQIRQLENSGRQIFIEQATRLEHHEIFWVIAGDAALIVDGRHTSLTAGNCYLLNPGQIRCMPDGGFPGLKGYYMSVSPEFIHVCKPGYELPFDYAAHQFRNELVVIGTSTGMQEEMEGITDKLFREYSNYYALRSEILHGLFRIFMIYLSRQWQGEAVIRARSHDAELVLRFTELVKKHISTRKMVADYANELSVTPNYLNRLVKKVSGCTASHHIQQYIVREAKRRAIYSGTSMKEIAYQLGFDDMAHFSKYFKNNSGMNFSRFKKDILSTL